MKKLSAAHLVRLVAAIAYLMAAGACGTLSKVAPPQTTFYALDSAQAATPPAPAAAPVAAPTLTISPPHAAAGFDSPHIIYVREAHKLEHFAHSEWIDPPARMLAPLLVATLARSGTFRAVVLSPSAAAGDIRLDTEIVRLQHDFQIQPSQVQFTLRAYLVDDKTRRVLAWREFNAAIPAASEDPYGGVVAANRAVQTVLDDLAAFCAETARSAPIEK